MCFIARFSKSTFLFQLNGNMLTENIFLFIILYEENLSIPMDSRSI